MNLTDDELILLDGKCRPGIQKEVDAAKTRIATIAANPDIRCEDAKFIADALTEARTHGELSFTREQLRHCLVCNRSAGYAKYARAGRYHRKGQNNTNRPLTFYGVELANRFVRMKGYATLGCCLECWTRIQPLLVEKLAGVEAEISHYITGQPPNFKRYKKAHCKECGWEGHQGQMRQLNALMGGQYPGGCPNCKAENRVFGATLIETVDGYVIVPQEQKAAA